MEPVSSVSLLIQAFEVKEVVVGAAEMLGLIASIDAKIDKLLNSDFNAGVRCLEELKLTSTKKHEYLLNEAWKHFRPALTHETLERKALAYLYLAFCQYRLGEQQLAYKTLTEFIQCEFVDEQERKKRTAIVLGAGGSAGALGGAATGGVAASAAAAANMAGGILAPTVVAVVSMPVAIGVGIVAGIAMAFGMRKKAMRKIEELGNTIPAEEKILQLKQTAQGFLSNRVISRI